MNYFTLSPPHLLFFQSWDFSTTTETAFLLLGLAFLSLLLEILKHITSTVKSKIVKCIARDSSDKYTCHETTDPATQRTQTSSLIQLELPFSQSLLLNLILAGIYVVRILIAYLLMLAVMTYNYWILIVIVFSAAVGYYLLPLWTHQTPRSQAAKVRTDESTSANERKTYKQLESTV